LSILQRPPSDRPDQTPPGEARKPAEGLSRRMALAGLAALPASAVAIPATASAAGADAELIALGKKIEPLVDAYYDKRKPWSQALVQRNSELDERFGEPADRSIHTPPGYAAVEKEIDDRVGMDAAADQLHVVFENVEPIARAIEALTCTSVEGLRAKALVAFWEIAPLCAGDTQFHFEDAYPFQRLFVAVAELCGLNGKIAATGFEMPNIDVEEDDGEEGEEA